MEYKNLLNFIVCDTQSKDCMIHRCSNCPKDAQLLKNYLANIIDDLEIANCIPFSQWTTTDRSFLVKHVETKENYIELVVDKLQQLTSHSYISKAQSDYLKDL